MSEALRRKLTNAGRVLAMQDQGDFVAGHVTVRLEDDKSRFLMKPATIGLEEMTPQNIITVDLDGQRVGGSMPRHNEVYIHSEVLRARSDLHAVIHTHAPHAVAFSSLGKELLPVNNEAGYFYKRLPVFSETSDLIVTADRGKAVAQVPRRPHRAALAQHGIVAAGRTLEEPSGSRSSSTRLPGAIDGGMGGRTEIHRRRRGPGKKEPARHAAGSLHQCVQLPRALTVPRARQAR